MLTGESVACGKIAFQGTTPPENLPDRKDMVYMGTTAVTGHGVARVCAIGMSTQMGRIAGMLAEIPDEQTPLQKKLDQLGKYIAIGCLIICALVSVAGVPAGRRTAEYADDRHQSGRCGSPGGTSRDCDDFTGTGCTANGFPKCTAAQVVGS